MKIISSEEKECLFAPNLNVEWKEKLKAILKEVGIGLLAGPIYFLCAYGLWIFLRL